MNALNPIGITQISKSQALLLKSYSWMGIRGIREAD